MRHAKTTPRKDTEWKVEPVPARSAADARVAELAALLATAAGRIRVLEAQLAELGGAGRARIIT